MADIIEQLIKPAEQRHVGTLATMISNHPEVLESDKVVCLLFDAVINSRADEELNHRNNATAKEHRSTILKAIGHRLDVLPPNSLNYYLHTTTKLDSTDYTSMLLTMGADPMLPDIWDKTSLHTAASSNVPNNLRVILHHVTTHTDDQEAIDKWYGHKDWFKHTTLDCLLNTPHYRNTAEKLRVMFEYGVHTPRAEGANQPDSIEEMIKYVKEKKKSFIKDFEDNRRMIAMGNPPAVIMTIKDFMNGLNEISKVEQVLESHRPRMAGVQADMVDNIALGSLSATQGLPKAPIALDSRPLISMQ